MDACQPYYRETLIFIGDYGSRLSPSRSDLGGLYVYFGNFRLARAAPVAQDHGAGLK